MSLQIRTSILELNEEKVTALTHHKPQVCAVDHHLLHPEQLLRAVGDNLLHL